MKKIVSILGTLMLLVALSVPVSAMVVQHNTQAGSAVTTSVEFPFTVVLTDADGNELTGEFEFTGTKSGTIRSGDTIMLGDADYIDILDLPEGTQYIVTEGVTDGWYLDESADTTGTIQDQGLSHAKFVNRESEPPRTGSLVISKTVKRDSYAEGVGDAIYASDGIPDDCQVVVDFMVVNGTPEWSQACLTLRDETGSPSENGTAVLAEAFIPEIYPDEGMSVTTAFVPDVVLTKNAAQEAVCDGAKEPRSITVTYVGDNGAVGVILEPSHTVLGIVGEPYVLTEAPATIDVDTEHYVLSDDLPKTVSADENSVTVHYALDIAGGGDNGREPDGIPDANQVVVLFTTSNGAYGTVSVDYQTFNLNSDSGTVHLNCLAETTELSRTYFSSWTNGGKIISSDASLDLDFPVLSGRMYEVIANFGRYGTGETPGGGGGGSSLKATVTFIVSNGKFDDGSTSKSVTISYAANESPTLSATDIPSHSPNVGYGPYAWDIEPLAGMTVENGQIFKVTYAPSAPVVPDVPILPAPVPTSPVIDIPDPDLPL